MCHQRRKRGELWPKFREQAGCEYNSVTHTCYGHTGHVVRGSGRRGPGKNSECKIFFSMAEEEGRCVVDDANTVVASGDRWPYTMKLGATPKQCLQKCRREKNLPISRPNVYGCEYQFFTGGTAPPKCEAITAAFKGGDRMNPPISRPFSVHAQGDRRICWTLLTRQTIADYLIINRNPWYCGRRALRKGCVFL